MYPLQQFAGIYIALSILYGEAVDTIEIIANWRPTTRRGNVGTVILVIVTAVGMVIGAAIFVRGFTVLDDLRDSDWSAAANTTVSNINADFWSGMSLLRMSLIIIPAAIVLGYLIRYLGGGGGG